MSLPETYKALVLSSFKDPLDFSVQTLPTPAVTPGSGIVRILSTRVNKSAQHMWGKTPLFPMNLPRTPGGPAIGRIAAIGPDAVTLKVGQLVYVDLVVHARDEPALTILQGAIGGGPPTQTLMDGEWRNGSYGQYMKAPIDNIYPLDEELLTKQMGYTIHELGRIGVVIIPYGGLADIGLKPGESILVAPATGQVGAAAVHVALVMGARVVAAGRNEAKLKEIVERLGSKFSGRISYVKITGDVAADAQALQSASPSGKGFDTYIDWSPPQAGNSTHIKSCLMALKTSGRASIMGGIQGDVSIPYFLVVMKSLKLMGKLMYERAQITQLIGMVESGLLRLNAESGVEVAGQYKLEDFAAAFEDSARLSGKVFTFEP